MDGSANNITVLRDNAIRKMDTAENATVFATQNAELLFNLGLSVYSRSFSLNSAIYNAFAQSSFDDRVSLHPDQLKVLDVIFKNAASIISAPTSFGKTYCIFEYLARAKPKTVVMVVPTLALRREYISSLMRTFKGEEEYRIYTDVPDKPVSDNEKTAFILTHERVIKGEIMATLPKVIDFLVIDEVYKLAMDSASDGRIIVLNIAYYLLAKRSLKYVLLAPYISEVKDLDKLDKKPVFFHSDYGPVVNDVIEMPILKNTDRFSQTSNLLLDQCAGGKTLVYFPGPNDISRYLRETEITMPSENDAETLDSFIDWAKREVGPNWSVVKAAERGFLVHHGQMPLGARDYLLSIFNDKQSGRNVLLCTSTLLEGVNTSAKNMIITSASRGSIRMRKSLPFAPFDFYNLAGRTGRLYQYYVGKVYYIKTPDEPSFRKQDANVAIRFQITNEGNVDIDLQTNEGRNSPEVRSFFDKHQMDIHDYLKEFGPTFRFEQLKKLTEALARDGTDKDYSDFYNTFMTIAKLSVPRGINPYYVFKTVERRNSSIRLIVDELCSNSECHDDADEIINQIVKIKNGSLEHQILPCAQYAAYYFARKGRGDISESIQKHVISTIKRMFYLDEPAKRMLKAIGVYDNDMGTILAAIGDDFSNLSDLRKRLALHVDEFIGQTGFITRFEVRRFIADV